MRGIAGILGLLVLAWLMSENRRNIRLWPIAAGLAFQFVAVALMFNAPFFKDLFLLLDGLVGALQDATTAGTSFVFGYLGGGPLPFEERQPGATFILATRALPLVLVVSALSSLLFYWRVLPIVVKLFSLLLERTMGIGGAVGLGAAANVFLGMVESPLFVRPYLGRMTRSELFATMSCGMAGVAGTVMVLYASILKPVIPDAMGHILTVSVITIPAAIIFAGIMIPETGEITTGRLTPPQEAHSPMDAITKGTADGISLLLNIIAMLVVLVALVHLVNMGLGILPAVDGTPLTLQRILGWVMAPVVWLIGIPWSEAPAAGALMGTKTVLNEFIAYLDMTKLPAGSLSPRSAMVMVYALCGFANFGSLGILIGGMGAMAPERKGEIVDLGLRSIVAGTLSTLMAGAIVGILY